MKLRGVDAEHLGQKLPGVLNGAFFEVISKGEIAEHLEERKMPGGYAHLINVRGAQTPLAGRGADVRFLLRDVQRFELHHPGTGKQQCGIAAGHQRVARHPPVPIPLEETQAGFPELTRRHDSLRNRSGEERAVTG